MSKWNFIESSEGGVPLGDKHVMIISTTGFDRRIVFNRKKLVQSDDVEVSIAIYEENNAIGIFKARRGLNNFSIQDLENSMAYVSCTSALITLGFCPGLYMIKRGTAENLLFSVSISQRVVEFPEGTMHEENAAMIQTHSAEKFAPKTDRLNACRMFVKELEALLKKKVVLKDRHNGYSLLVPGGKTFGYIRMNEHGGSKGYFIVYIFDQTIDDERRFVAQSSNENSLKYMFDPKIREDREYVLKVFVNSYNKNA